MEGHQLVVAEVEEVPYPGWEVAAVQEVEAGRHLLLASEAEAVEARQGVRLARGLRHQASGVVVVAAQVVRANPSSQAAPALRPVVEEAGERSESFGPGTYCP